jgi:hypothetical protein
MSTLIQMLVQIQMLPAGPIYPTPEVRRRHSPRGLPTDFRGKCIIVRNRIQIREGCKKNISRQVFRLKLRPRQSQAQRVDALRVGFEKSVAG